MGVATPKPWDVPAPGNLPHALGVVETVCWFVESARLAGLPRPRIRLEGPRWRSLVPDLHLVVALPQTALNVLVEVDKGTEGGKTPDSRWSKKCENYAALFGSGDLERVTGYNAARVLVVAPNLPRFKWLYQYVSRHFPEPWRIWYTLESGLHHPGFQQLVWFNDESQKPLLTSHELTHESTREADAPPTKETTHEPTSQGTDQGAKPPRRGFLRPFPR